MVPEIAGGSPSGPASAERIRAACESGYQRFEWVYLKADGSELFVDVSLTPIVIRGEKIGLTADLFVPVALHEQRIRERGYNQATLLARELSRKTGIPVREDVVRRCRDTRPQVGLSQAERRANVAGAFACTTRLDGQSVVLSDDVATTGSTLEACATALKQAGAAAVLGYTLARARSTVDDTRRV